MRLLSALKHDEPLPNFAFNFELRPYTEVSISAAIFYGYVFLVRVLLQPPRVVYHLSSTTVSFGHLII